MFWRPKPTLLILSNPATAAVPDEDLARREWSKFHLKPGNAAAVKVIKDIPGMPKTVMVLGACEEVEVATSKSARAKGRVVKFGRDHENGPWLVMSPKHHELFVVSSGDRDLDRVPDKGYVVSFVYHPGKRSGKHDPRSFQHKTGEGGPRSEREWWKDWPRVEWVHRRAFLLDGPYTVEPRGVVR